ncbi:5-oxoprolinase subunit PxpB [Pseudoxanthobacter sp.]|uniref:5-oxoprolinase subunit PxpB n=1 Tax=Pseudoxanthobacter sp. TaxID=1925742 RepID=UPI002FE2F455
MSPPASPPRFLDAGDGGLVIELGQSIDPAISAQVMALDAALAARRLEGVREQVPSYRSLLVMFDPLVTSRQAIAAAVQALWPPPPLPTADITLWRVPVLYGGAAGADLAFVAATHGLSEEAVVRLHAGAAYRVYMIGFAPGFAYLGGLPAALATSRRSHPRPATPPGSVSIGGEQTAVSPPLPIPSGWHLIGRTPVRSYDPARESRPVLFAPGDHIRFEPVGTAEFEALSAAAEAGDPVARAERLAA